MKRIWIFLISITICAGVIAQPVSIDNCIEMAIDHSSSLKMADESLKIANNARSQAISNYFPHIGVIGSYQWNQKNIELIDYGSLMYGMLLPQEIRHLTRIDIQNVMVADVALVQPIFMGGKIVAMNQVANYGKTVAENNVKQMRDNISLLTQENYWLIVSLAQKKVLTHNMVELLSKTHDNVGHLIEEGMATPSDLLNVDVRLNEMQLAESKIDQNLIIAKYNMMQLCGIDLNDTIVLVDELNENALMGANQQLVTLDTSNICENRTDIANLELEKKITKKQETIVRSSLLPNVVLNANYFVSNPSVYNGFRNTFDGMFNVGVSVNIPITNWIDGGFKINSAKASTHIKDLEIQAAKDNAQLEMRQALLQYEQASKTLQVAQQSEETAVKNLESAEVRFEEGMSNTLALMEAQTAWLKARTSLIDADIDIHLSELALQKASGQIRK